MGGYQWTNPLVTAQSDGASLTAAAAASCLPPAAKFGLPNNFFAAPGKMLRITASGRISCVVTTPGTARYDVRLGSIVVFDGLAVPLNIVAKTNVGWMLEILLTCRTIGQSTSATLMGQGRWTSEAGVGAVAASVAGAAPFLLPYNTAPVVGNGFDSTAIQFVDLFFTQTVATGAMTLHQYMLEEIG